MKYLYSGKEAKAIDRFAIEEMGMSGLVLMERAAMSVAVLLMNRESRDASFLAVCGTGNNGGDGVATARILHEQGYKAAITVVGEMDRMTEDMKYQLSLAVKCGVSVVPMASVSEGGFDVMIDCLFGIGLSREVTGVYEKIIDEINESDAVCYAVDIPSGIHAATGEIMNTAVRADCTVTFGVNKTGLVLYPGCEYAGEVFVTDIGFPAASVSSVNCSTYFYEKEDLKRLPIRPRRSHKGTFGHVLVVAGSESMSGACYFASKAAYLAGAGLVRAVSTENNRDVLLNVLPELLFSPREELGEVLSWADAVVIGPGIGLEKEAEEMVQYILDHSPVPTVMDGDAIHLCAGLTKTLSDNFVLTPHVKEMTYLTGKTVPELLNHILTSTREAAAERGCTIVQKDARTIVSNGGEAYINTSGNNGMATGGSGDVLAGLIGGLLAQRMEPFEAAKLAVYVHGLAGDIMAQETSEYSLMASDLLTGIAKVLHDG